jgi:hypothetical protein
MHARSYSSDTMQNNPITAMLALGSATADLASLDADLDQLVAAVRAFKAKATRITRRVAAKAEAVSEAIYAARDRRDPDAAPDRAEEVLLDGLADLPSGSPEDLAETTIQAVAEYRKALRGLAAAAGTLTGGNNAAAALDIHQLAAGSPPAARSDSGLWAAVRRAGEVARSPEEK